MHRSLTRVFLFSLVTTLLLIVATIGGCYFFTADRLHVQNEQTARTTLTETARRAETLLSTQKSMGEVVTSHNDVVAFLYGTSLQRLQLRDNVRALLTNYVSFSSGAIMAYLYSSEGNWLSSTDNDSRENRQAFRISRGLVDEYRLQTPFRNSFITDSFTFEEKNYYAVINPVFRPIAAPSLSDYEGCLILLYQAERLADFIPEGEYISGFVRSGERLLGGDKKIFARWKQGAVGSVSRTIAGTDWTIELVLNMEQDLETLRHMRALCWCVGLASLGAMIVLTLNQYRRIIRPIIEIANQTAAVRRNGDLLDNRYPQANELNQLVQGVNDMLLRLHQLNEEVLRVKTKYYEEQIAFFQAQINPHFLFNTFECIRGMASEGKMEEVRTATSCMAGIYRYCAVKTPLVPLKMEYDCLRQYMRVMELRYGPVYQLTLEGDKEALERQTPRMCLQPLVENAITHGFHIRPENVGHIYLTSRVENGALKIVLEDDGQGMSEEKIAYYNAAQPVHIDGLHSHIGLTNVMRRFALLFHDRSRISFSRSEYGGLKIQIEIFDA